MEGVTNSAKNEDEIENEVNVYGIYQESYQYFLDAKHTDYLLPSPINLDISLSTKISFPKLTWKGYDLVPTQMKVANSGQTVILSAKWQGSSPYLTGGPFGKSKYVFTDLHFHWGKTALEGSEHLIEGNQCAMEMHVRHAKSNYHSNKKALKKDDVVVMVVYLFEVKFHDNPVLQHVLLNMQNIRQAGCEYHLEPFEVNKLVIPFDQDYYAYWGSRISTPDEHRLLWIICRQLNSCSMSQLRLFHYLYDSSLRTIARNWRPVKSTEKRTLFHVNPISPYCSQTMNPKPIMYLDSVQNISNTSLRLDEKTIGGTKNKHQLKIRVEIV